MHNTPAYKTWCAMRARCLNPKNKQYQNYGGRGITICTKWGSFIAFFIDMGERPPGTSIERINNDKPYNKKNCRWATPLEQGRNRRNNHWLEYAGQRLTVSEWARKLDLRPLTLLRRLQTMPLPLALQSGRLPRRPNGYHLSSIYLREQR